MNMELDGLMSGLSALSGGARAGDTVTIDVNITFLK